MSRIILPPALDFVFILIKSPLQQKLMTGAFLTKTNSDSLDLDLELYTKNCHFGLCMCFTNTYFSICKTLFLKYILNEA